MGEPKAGFMLAGRPMADWVTDALASVCDAIVVAGPSWRGLPTVQDEPGVAGPLAGILGAVRYAPGPVLVVAVDQPWVRTETLLELRRLHDGDQPLVPIDAGTAQVTCAVFTPALLAAEPRQSVQAALDAVVHQPVARDVWHTWGEDGRSWFSVDEAADAVRGIDRFGQPG